MTEGTVVSTCTAFTTTLILLILALVGSIYPLYTHPTSPFLRFGNVFAGGFLLTVALTHLYPEGQELLESSLSPSFPLSSFLVLFGIAFMFIIEYYLHGKLCDESYSDLEEGPRAPSTSSYTLAIALSLHSFVEGVALGAAMRDSSHFTVFYAAIATHKLFEAVSVGVDLGRGVRNGGNQAIAMSVAGVYSALTPLGVVFGRSLVQGMTESAEILEGVLNCISAGIFLYAALAEMLVEEIHIGWKHDGPEKTLVFITSIVFMSVLTTLTENAE